MKALVIIDMLDDFVHGALANPRAQTIVAPLQELLEYARKERWAVVFSNDAHLPGLGVDEVVLAGQHTHICVRHSAYGALIRGYAIAVPRDAVCAFEGVDEEDALEYLRTVYGARITSVAELVGQGPEPL